MANVAALWRHPIKSHGREALTEVTLTAGQTMPWDRVWAVTHGASQFDTTAPVWTECQNFMIGTMTPGLAGLWAKVDEGNASVTLRHQDLSELTFAPDEAEGVAAFLDWVSPLCPDNRPRPQALVKVPGRGMTDTDYPSVSVMNLASHQAVADRLGQPLESERWRGNIWLDGLEAWTEFDWFGRTIGIGPVVLAVREPIKRCLHTAANPVTGERDADTLGALRAGWGHRNFGVYTEVVTGGTVRLGDTFRVI